jgi:hypothetical protein
VPPFRSLVGSVWEDRCIMEGQEEASAGHQGIAGKERHTTQQGLQSLLWSGLPPNWKFTSLLLLGPQNLSSFPCSDKGRRTGFAGERGGGVPVPRQMG